MGTVSLEQIHEDLMSMKKEIDDIKSYLEEDSFGLKEEIKEQIKESRKKKESDFISHEEIEKEFL